MTRTTLRPSMSTICLSMRSARSRISSGRWLELVDVDRGRAEARAADVERLDRRPGQEDPPPVRLDDEPGHGRIAVADRDDQVGDLADRIALPVADGPADHLAQVEHLPPRGGIHPARRWRAPDGRRPSEGGRDRCGSRGRAGTGSWLHEWSHPPVLVRTVDGGHGQRRFGAPPGTGAECSRRPAAGSTGRPSGRVGSTVGYIITRPPSTARTWPVMKAASSEARKATAAATSSVVPNRPSGVRAMSSSRSGWGRSCGQLGQDEARRDRVGGDPARASSRAVAFVSPIRPALADE